MDVKVSYDDLGDLYTRLLAIATEFDQASSRKRDLQDDIDRPYGEGELRSLAGDFESGWDDRRHKLGEGLDKVSEHAHTILEKFGDFDFDAARKLAEAMQEVD